MTIELSKMDFRLSFGNGEDEDYNLKLKGETLIEIYFEILRIFNERDLTNYFVQLEISTVLDQTQAPSMQIGKVWSLYNKDTGYFDDWDGYSLHRVNIVSDEISAFLSWFITEKSTKFDTDEITEMITEYRVVTERGEKTIFSVDSENIYTLCGLCVPYGDNTWLREIELPQSLYDHYAHTPNVCI